MMAEFDNPHPSQSTFRVMKSRRMRRVGHVVRIENKRDVYRVLVGKPNKNIPLGRFTDRWDDNIKMCLQEIGWWH